MNASENTALPNTTLEGVLTPSQYYDVVYKTPIGITGTHYAVEANSLSHAEELTPIMLSYGTPWHPSEFKVLSVTPTPETNKPK